VTRFVAFKVRQESLTEVLLPGSMTGAETQHCVLLFSIILFIALPGPSFVFVTPKNLTNGYWHSPGPRYGAAVASISSSEVLLVGGYTYSNSSASDTMVALPRDGE
jgi:hypothetical protein